MSVFIIIIVMCSPERLIISNTFGINKCGECHLQFACIVCTGIHVQTYKLEATVQTITSTIHVQYMYLLFYVVSYLVRLMQTMMYHLRQHQRIRTRMVISACTVVHVYM